MNEQELTRGLTALADQTPHLSVDVDNVIMTAVSRAKRNRIVTAAAFSTTVVLAGAITFVTLNGSGAPPDLNPAATSPKPSKPPTNSIPLSTKASPYNKLPKPLTPAHQRKIMEFADRLTERIPVVVPGTVTAEQTYRVDIKDGNTVNYVTINKTSGGAHSKLKLAVESAASVANASMTLNWPCREITTPEPNYPERVCYRQPDGSLVYLQDREVSKPSGSSLIKARFVDHVRKDGSYVSILNYNAAEKYDFLPEITDQQFIKLVTDPAFTLK